MYTNRLLFPVTISLLVGAGPAVAQEEPILTVRRVVLIGARSLPEAELTATVSQQIVGKAGTPEAVRAAAEAVVGVYKERGFPVARVVQTDIDPDGTLRLTIAEGTIRSIVVRGNGKTKTATIRAAMETQPGEVYRAERVAGDRDRLSRLGVFEDVLVAPEPVDPGATGEDAVGLVDVVVRVKERRTGNLAATLGYGERTGLLGYVDLSETNFAGRAQRVSVQFQRLSQARLDENQGRLVEEEARAAYRASFFAPFIGRGQTAVGIDLYDQNTVFQPLFAGSDESLRDYERRRGGTLRVGRALASGLALFASVRRDQIGYDRVPLRLNPPFARLSGADGTVGALGLELIADARDAAENPRRGYRYSLAYENASSIFGGTHRFGQTVVDARHYLPLSSAKNPAVLALRVLGGTSSGTVPLPEQFWIGGYELLRGYDLYSIRGDRLLLASVEARVPLSQGVQGVLFGDFGNAWETGSSAGLRSGVGLGLRFLSPIGPIRFDAAYGDEFKTYVSLGQAY